MSKKRQKKTRPYPGEIELQDTDAVFNGEWYVVNGLPMKCDGWGTVGAWKVDLNELMEDVDTFEVKYCNKFARRLS